MNKKALFLGFVLVFLAGFVVAQEVDSDEGAEKKYQEFTKDISSLVGDVEQGQNLFRVNALEEDIEENLKTLINNNPEEFSRYLIENHGYGREADEDDEGYGLVLDGRIEDVLIGEDGEIVLDTGSSSFSLDALGYSSNMKVNEDGSVFFDGVTYSNGDLLLSNRESKFNKDLILVNRNSYPVDIFVGEVAMGTFNRKISLVEGVYHFEPKKGEGLFGLEGHAFIDDKYVLENGYVSVLDAQVFEEEDSNAFGRFFFIVDGGSSLSYKPNEHFGQKEIFSVGSSKDFLIFERSDPVPAGEVMDELLGFGELDLGGFVRFDPVRSFIDVVPTKGNKIVINPGEDFDTGKPFQSGVIVRSNTGEDIGGIVEFGSDKDFVSVDISGIHIRGDYKKILGGGSLQVVRGENVGSYYLDSDSMVKLEEGHNYYDLGGVDPKTLPSGKKVYFYSESEIFGGKIKGPDLALEGAFLNEDYDKVIAEVSQYDRLDTESFIENLGSHTDEKMQRFLEQVYEVGSDEDFEFDSPGGEELALWIYHRLEGNPQEVALKGLINSGNRKGLEEGLKILEREKDVETLQQVYDFYLNGIYSGNPYVSKSKSIVSDSFDSKSIDLTLHNAELGLIDLIPEGLEEEVARRVDLRKRALVQAGDIIIDKVGDSSLSSAQKVSVIEYISTNPNLFVQGVSRDGFISGVFDQLESFRASKERLDRVNYEFVLESIFNALHFELVSAHINEGSDEKEVEYYSEFYSGRSSEVTRSDLDKLLALLRSDDSSETSTYSKAFADGIVKDFLDPLDQIVDLDKLDVLE